MSFTSSAEACIASSGVHPRLQPLLVVKICWFESRPGTLKHGFLWQLCTFCCQMIGMKTDASGTRWQRPGAVSMFWPWHLKCDRPEVRQTCAGGC